MMSNWGLCNVSHGNSSALRAAWIYFCQRSNSPTNNMYTVRLTPFSAEYLKTWSFITLFHRHNNFCVIFLIKNYVMFLQLWKKPNSTTKRDDTCVSSGIPVLVMAECSFFSSWQILMLIWTFSFMKIGKSPLPHTFRPECFQYQFFSFFRSPISLEASLDFYLFTVKTECCVRVVFSFSAKCLIWCLQYSPNSVSALNSKTTPDDTNNALAIMFPPLTDLNSAVNVRPHFILQVFGRSFISLTELN